MNLHIIAWYIIYWIFWCIWVAVISYLRIFVSFGMHFPLLWWVVFFLGVDVTRVLRVPCLVPFNYDLCNLESVLSLDLPCRPIGVLMLSIIPNSWGVDELSLVGPLRTMNVIADFTTHGWSHIYGLPCPSVDSMDPTDMYYTLMFQDHPLKSLFIVVRVF